MAQYEGDYLHIYEANRRLIEFLREIASPVPRPLQVAADVALTHDAVAAARTLAVDKLDPTAARADLLGLAQLAARLGARIDLEALRVPLHAALRAHFDMALAGKREAAFRAADLVALGVQRGPRLALWAMQNQPWNTAPC